MSTIKDIREKAVLVQFTDHIWRANIADKAVSTEVADQKQAKNSNVGSYRKSLIPKVALQNRRQIGNNARMYHYENTLPWMDGGIRILPAKNITAYMNKLRQFKKEAQAAEQEFFSNYDKYKEEAKETLGKLYKEEDYPALEDIKSKFELEVVTFPVPEIKDWRVDVSSKEMDELRKEAMENFAKVQKNAMMDLWDRLYEVVSKMEEKLNQEDGIFRDSLVENINKMLELIPVLNITEDPELSKLATEVKQKLTKATPAALREDKAVRSKAGKDAKAIMKKMDMYMKKGGAR